MNIILSLYPNSRGLGYACIELPQKLLDSGIVTVRPICNDRLLARIEKYMDFFKPKIIVVRDADALTPRGKRIKRLITAVIESAVERGIPIHQYSRDQMKEVFEQFGTSTKYEIAQKLIQWFPELADRAPGVRKPWMDEDYNMGVFDALALAVTHAYLTE